MPTSLAQQSNSDDVGDGSSNEVAGNTEGNGEGGKGNGDGNEGGGQAAATTWAMAMAKEGGRQQRG